MRTGVAAAVALVVVVLAACGGEDVPSGAEPADELVTVTRIVDGDTLAVDTGETVRLIGVDTPETRHPDLGVQCYGREATAFLEELLPPGTPVRLELDVEHRDRYDRTLAYVHRASDDLFVNLHLAEQGYAQAATVPPNVAHADDFVAAQRAAREAGRGLWSACQVDGDPDGGDGTGAPTTGCDPAYPDRCLPPPPPDLDCRDLGPGAVVVLPPDPHRLDGNGDGVGCG